MDHPNKKESPPIALRFSLRHLLLAMTIASILMGVATLLPREVTRFLLRLVDLGLIAGLVAGAMVYSGRLKIACVAALLPLIVAAFGSHSLGPIFRDILNYLLNIGLDRNFVYVLTVASRWAEAAISGTVAYVVAGWLKPTKEAE